MKFFASYLAATAAVRIQAHPPKRSLTAIEAMLKDWYSDNGVDGCDLAAGAILGIYDLIDADNSGSVTLGEFEAGIAFLADGAQFEATMRHLFDAADTDQSGALDVEEIKAGVAALNLSKED